MLWWAPKPLRCSRMDLEKHSGWKELMKAIAIPVMRVNESTCAFNCISLPRLVSVDGQRNFPLGLSCCWANFSKCKNHTGAPFTPSRCESGKHQLGFFIQILLVLWKADGNQVLRRLVAVLPFCFGYPAQPDIASWHIRMIIHILINGRFSSPLDTRGDPRSLEAFFVTPVDFLSVSRHDPRAPCVVGMPLDQKT